MARADFSRQPILEILAFAAISTIASTASADTYSVSVSPALNIGQVAAAPTGTTTFRIDPQSGQLSLVSGSGYRIGSSLARLMVTITCAAQANGVANGSSCNKNKVIVTIGSIGITTGRALPLTNFTVSMSSASLSGSVVGSNPIIFMLNPVGSGQNASFYLGSDFPVAGDDTGKSTGTGLSPFYVYVSDTSGNQLASTLSSGMVTAFRSLSVAKSSDLQFGAVIKPLQGSGSVTIDPSSGARTFTGGVNAVSSVAAGPAVFTVNGEGGQTFYASVPSTIQLSGPTNLNVQTSTNLPASPVLSGSTGSTGTFTLQVGGTLPVSSGSISGTYTGTWTVTVGYD